MKRRRKTKPLSKLNRQILEDELLRVVTLVRKDLERYSHELNGNVGHMVYLEGCLAKYFKEPALPAEKPPPYIA